MEFLGQQMIRCGMTPAESKLKVVHDWAMLNNVKNVRSFLGFTNCYERFVKNFVEIANPLIELTKKEMTW